MRSKLAILLIGFAACVVGVIFVCVSPSKGARISVSVPHVLTNGPIPLTLTATFTITNQASDAASIQVSGIERMTPNGWVADSLSPRSRYFLPLGIVLRGSNEQFSTEIPGSICATRLRLRIANRASGFEKARFAALQLFERFALGDKQITQYWCSNLYVPSYEIVTPEIRMRKSQSSEETMWTNPIRTVPGEGFPPPILPNAMKIETGLFP